MVKDPKDYRWCGYSEAMAGSALARLGIARALEKCDDEQSAQEVLESAKFDDR